MIIQFNTDKTITGDEKHEEYFTSKIAEGVKNYDSHITRIEVHLKDVNGNKEGPDDIHCLLEARLEGKNPIVVSDEADTIEQAVSGSIKKLKASLKTIVEQMQEH